MHESTGPGISVIVPVFISERCPKIIQSFSQAISSILKQSFPGPWELLLIDDGSLISLMDVIHSEFGYHIPELIFCRLPRNYGLVYALNYGLQKARFPFVARLDADDSWRNHKIKKQMEIFEVDHDVSIVGTGMAFHDMLTGKTLEIIRAGNYKNILGSVEQVGCPFPHGSIVALTDVYRLLGGYPHEQKFRHCEDMALWTTWLRFFKGAMLEEVLLDYRYSKNSVSNKNRQQQLAASAFLRDRFCSLVDPENHLDYLYAVSDSLSLSLIDTGKLLFIMWKFRPRLLIPKDSVEFINAIMPDRLIVEDGCSGSRMIRPYWSLLSTDGSNLRHKDLTAVKVMV